MTITKEACSVQFMVTKRKISQAQMGEFLGVSQQYVNLLIKNKLTPKIDRLKHFSNKTGTDVLFWFESTGFEKESAIKQAIESQSEVQASSLESEAR